MKKNIVFIVAGLILFSSFVLLSFQDPEDNDNGIITIRIIEYSEVKGEIVVSKDNAIVEELKLRKITKFSDNSMTIYQVLQKYLSNYEIISATSGGFHSGVMQTYILKKK